WNSALLGDLDEADRVSSQGLAQIQPGQVPAWTLHLVVWRTYTLTLLGRWARRAREGRPRPPAMARGAQAGGWLCPARIGVCDRHCPGAPGRSARRIVPRDAGRHPGGLSRRQPFQAVA